MLPPAEGRTSRPHRERASSGREFAVFFLTATWLLRRGRATAGTVFAGLLCLFEVVEFPSWPKHNALDWTYQTTFALESLAGLIAAITVLADRIRHRAAA
jgi:hypothetical protein